MKYGNTTNLSIWHGGIQIIGHLSLEQAKDIISLIAHPQDITKISIEFCQKFFEHHTNINLDTLCDTANMNNDIHDVKFNQSSLLFTYDNVRIIVFSSGKIIVRGLGHIPSQETIMFVHSVLGLTMKKCVMGSK